MRVEGGTRPHLELRTRQLDPARTSGAGSAPLASPGLHQPTPLTPAPAPLQVRAPPGPSPWIWSMMPRSLRSTSRRFSRSCRPMRTRLRSSRRKSAEAFTSSTPRLAARGEGLLGVLASGEQGGSAAQPTQGPTLPSPPLSASDSSWPRDCRFPRDPGSDRGGQFPVSPGGYGGRRGTSPDPVLREVGRSTPHPPRATGHVPASRLAPTASQQQEHSQEHERGARPVETGAAVPVVQEAVSPHLLGAGGGRVRGWGTSRRRGGAGTL